MAKETVLLYNCGGDEFKTLRALLMMLRVRVRMVEPSRYHLPLEQVAAGKGEEDPKQQADIPEAMMVFCDLGPGRLDQLLNTMRRTEFPPEGSADSHQPDVGFPPALAGAAPGARGDAGRSGNPVKIH